MTNLLPDDSYCTSEIGKLLFQSKNDWAASCRLISATDQVQLGVTFTAYNLEIKFLSKNALVEEPRLFRVSTRYKEASKLHAALSKLHKQLYLRGTFPLFPAAKFFGKPDAAGIEERKTAIVQTFHFVLDSEVLRKARVLHEFCQKAEEIAPSGEPAILLQGAESLMDAPALDVLSDVAPVLEPTHEGAAQVAETSETVVADETASPVLITQDNAEPEEFEFPELAVSSSIPDEYEPSEAPTAIRRLLSKMPHLGHSSKDGSHRIRVNNYLVDAGKLVSTAQRAEQEQAYEIAFQCLKTAAQILMQGSLTEKDLTLRNALRRKTAKYMIKAEKIYRTHLAYDGTTFEFETLYLATQDPNIMAFQCSNSLLKNYRIVGIAPDLNSESRIFVVEEKGSGTRYAMKLLEKGRSEAEGRSFLPSNVPHMVRLVKFFQTEIFIILLVEFAECGRLWSFLVRYFNHCAKKAAKFMDDDSRLTAEGNIDGKTHLYKGSRLHFSVGIDYERLARMEQDTLRDCDTTDDDVDMDSAPELCSVGVDALDVGSDEVFDRSEIVVPGPSSTDELQIRVEEEAPAPLRLTRTPCSRDSVDCQSSLATLSACLAECASRLGSGRRRAWPSSRPLPEPLVAHWAAQLVSMFYVLHSHGEILGDLVPDNVLVGADGNIVVTYFAYWNEIGFERKRFEPGYSAPECFAYPLVLTPASDVWTLGAILYELLTGRPLREALPHGIGITGEVYIPDYCNVSFPARDILSRILCENGDERLSLDEIRMHAFFAPINWQLYDNPHTGVSSVSDELPGPSKDVAPNLLTEQLIPPLTARDDVEL